MDRLRVLHCYAGNLYGGIETMLATMARERSACPSLEPAFALCFEGRLGEELRAAGVDLHILPPVRASRPWTVWRARKRLRDLLAQEQFDAAVCHACWPMAVFGPAVAQANCPLVFWAHDVLTGKPWTERWAARLRPELVIANSRFTAQSVGRVFHLAPVEVVYCPVAQACLETTVRDETRKELKANAADVVILMASRMERWKGFTVLLEALAKLPRQPAWSCWIAGGAQRSNECALLDELQGLAKRFELQARVKFLGQRADVPRLMAAADVYCQPNLSPEPFGVALIEALYAGLPVVTSAAGGALEIADDSCGTTVAPGDAAGLAGVLTELVGNAALRARLGGRGTARAKSLCDPGMILERVKELCSRLATAAPRQ